MHSNLNLKQFKIQIKSGIKFLIQNFHLLQLWLGLVGRESSSIHIKGASYTSFPEHPGRTMGMKKFHFTITYINISSFKNLMTHKNTLVKHNRM